MTTKDPLPAPAGTTRDASDDRSLRTREIASYLAARGVTDQVPTSVTELTGGVSGTVWRVAFDQGRDLVVKQARSRLDVADPWDADPARILIEAQTIALVAGMTPTRVPVLVDVDDQRYALVEEALPDDWTDWRERLLTGRVDEHTAAALGRLLATWHTGTAGMTPPASLLEHRSFRELRLGPYFETSATRIPALRSALDAVVAQLDAATICLVHGDFSPKNILVPMTADRVVVIDWEVGHWGDPAFDVAFLITHLLLKALHRPDHDDSARDVMTHSFVREYGSAAGMRDPDLVRRLVGALMVARIVGSSPVGYLDASARARALDVGQALLLDPTGTTWEHVF